MYGKIVINIVYSQTRDEYQPQCFHWLCFKHTSGFAGSFKIGLMKCMKKKKKKKRKGKGSQDEGRALFFPKGHFFQSVSILYVL